MILAILDPHLLPIESVAQEAGLAAERLTGAWLRNRFAHPPSWHPEIDDEQHMRQVTTAPRSAAVLIPIVLRQDGTTVLFTRRTADLRDHAGQISFPGGSMELSDASAVDTALRETVEEINLARSHVEVIGALPEYFTGTGYRITPVVGLVMPPFDVAPDPREVAEIFEVPLAFLMNGMNHQKRMVDLPGDLGRRTFYSMPYGHFFIWGATAGMLRNLFHFLRSE